MKRPPRHAVGIAMIVVGVSGIVISLTAIIVGEHVIRQIETSVDDSLELTGDALAAVSDSITVVDSLVTTTRSGMSVRAERDRDDRDLTRRRLDRARRLGRLPQWLTSRLAGRGADGAGHDRERRRIGRPHPPRARAGAVRALLQPGATVRPGDHQPLAGDRPAAQPAPSAGRRPSTRRWLRRRRSPGRWPTWPRTSTRWTDSSARWPPSSTATPSRSRTPKTSPAPPASHLADSARWAEAPADPVRRGLRLRPDRSPLARNRAGPLLEGTSVLVPPRRRAAPDISLK